VLFLFLWCFGDCRWLNPGEPAIFSVLDCLVGVLLYCAMTYWAFLPVALVFYWLLYLTLEGLLLKGLHRSTSWQGHIWAAIAALYAMVAMEAAIIPVASGKPQ
jgi:hypothetical protein